MIAAVYHNALVAFEQIMTSFSFFDEYLTLCPRGFFSYHPNSTDTGRFSIPSSLSNHKESWSLRGEDPNMAAFQEPKEQKKPLGSEVEHLRKTKASPVGSPKAKSSQRSGGLRTFILKL